MTLLYDESILRKLIEKPTPSDRKDEVLITYLEVIMGKNLKQFFTISFYLLLVLSSTLPVVSSGQPAPTSRNTLIIGTKEAPPFVIRNEDGTYSGISIDLWDRLAKDLNLKYRLTERDLEGLLRGLRDRSLDAAVGALTITAERAEDIDFTHPFHTAGLGVAVYKKGKKSWHGIINRILSSQFIGIVALLSFILFLMAVLVWFFERRRNVDQFGGGILKGIGSGFWWSAVTMTTVGYGDKAPRTFWGRFVALIWMFAAIIMVSSFTATIASILTVSQIEASIKTPEDLAMQRVGTVANSTSEEYLIKNRLHYRVYESPEQGLQAILDGEVDAMVYDVPILKYLVNKQMKKGLEVLPFTFERQDYGIGLQADSPLRKSINLTLLQIIQEPSWQDILNQYLNE